eukprot:6603369-Pyramimonas_sp.AAC.1
MANVMVMDCDLPEAIDELDDDIGRADFARATELAEVGGAVHTLENWAALLRGWFAPSHAGDDQPGASRGGARFAVDAERMLHYIRCIGAVNISSDRLHTTLVHAVRAALPLSLIHISEPTRPEPI